ncbi:hypothetical protein BDR05DRAFT_954385 [Suillus weaverae]|nr:hypothetical protein BDR05DRAFT_954385 [Suillus weaverae]
MTKTAHAGTKKAQQPPTAGSQNGHGADTVKVEETFKKISSHDIKINKEFLEYISYSKDQKGVVITVGWEILTREE